MTNQLVLICCFLLSALPICAQHQLEIKLNKSLLKKGDTLISRCAFTYSDPGLAASTLHVWIENKSGTSKWRYRFPLVNGECLFNLVVDSNLSEDIYALNYLVQPQFFKVTGNVRNYSRNMNGINMLVMAQNAPFYSGSFVPDSKGIFQTKQLLFEDTAQFTFTPNTKQGGDLLMKIATPLDSSFTPVATSTVLVSVGEVSQVTGNNYQFDSSRFNITAKQLSEIVVTADVRATKLKSYQQKFVSGLFKGISTDINGFYNTRLLESPDLFAYLQQVVTGLSIQKRGTSYIVSRRNQLVDLFLDQVRVGPEELNFLHPGDVALVKIFEPGFGPMMSYGGSLAIYTKKGEDLEAAVRQRSVYQIFGYNSAVSIWR